MKHGYKDPSFCSYFAARGTRNRPSGEDEAGSAKTGLFPGMSVGDLDTT